jgi:hypothetical protein
MDDALVIDTDEEMEEFLTDAVEAFADEEYGARPRVETYSRAGILTMNRGLVIALGNREWQLTIVRSR